MINSIEIKKLRLIFIPVVAVLIIDLIFEYFNPATFNYNFQDPEVIYKSDFLLKMQSVIVFWILFSWEFLISKKWVSSVIILIVAAFCNIIGYLNLLPIEFHFLIVLFNSYGILIIARSYLIKKPKNLFIKYLLGIGYTLITYYGNFLFADYMHMFDFIRVLNKYNIDNLFLLLVFYSFLYFHIFLFDRINVSDMLRHFLNPPNEKITRSEFLWNFIFSYGFFVLIYFALSQFFTYEKLSPEIGTSFINFISLSMLFASLLMVAVNIINLSVKWLNQNTRSISWNLLLLMIPVINLINLIVITSPKSNLKHISQFKSERSVRDYESSANESCRNFLIFIQIIVALYVSVTYVKIMSQIDENKWIQFIIIFTIVDLILFFVFTKYKKALYLLLLNAVVIFIVHINLNLLQFNDIFSTLIYTFLSYMILLKILHPKELMTPNGL